MPAASSKIQISQTDNYAANFGEVLRSSAIFWVRNDDNSRTTTASVSPATPASSSTATRSPGTNVPSFIRKP